MPPRYFKNCFYFFIGRHFVFTYIFIFILVHHKFLNSSWTVIMNCSWTFVLEQFMNCDDELFINVCSWTSKFNFLRTVCELFMNYFWVHNKFLNSSWTFIHLTNTVNFSGTIDELFMNFFFHSKFLNSSWTVMVNCSWTLVHEPTIRVFYELFMNVHECSWTVHKVMNYISPGSVTSQGLLSLYSYKRPYGLLLLYIFQ